MTTTRQTILTLILCTLYTMNFSQGTSWQKYFGFGYAVSFEDINRDDPIEEWQGYTSSYQRIDSTDFGHGFYVHYEISNGKWHFPVRLGMNIWHNNIYGIKHRLNPQGSSISQYDVYYEDYSFYGQFSIGAGYDLFNSSDKFDLIPLVQINPEFNLGHNIVVNEYYGWYEDIEDSGLATAFIDSDTTQYSGIMKYTLALEPSVGIDFRYNLGTKTTLRISTSYYWKNFSRTTFGNIKRKTHGLNGSIGLLFEI